MPSPSERGLDLERAHLLLWALLTGLLGGGAALALRSAATLLPSVAWPDSRDLVHAVALATPAQRMVIPSVGALLAGLVLVLGERWAGGTQGWDILEAVVLRDGTLPLRPTLVKSASSLLTVASAGPVGREGPIVLMASTVGSLLGRWRGLPTRQRRILVACGAAAGLACAYNTPIAAALFTMEILLGSFALEAFVPIAVSAGVATLLTRAFLGDVPVFGVGALAMKSPWEIVPYATLGLLGGLVAAAFLVALRLSSALFRRLRWPRPVAMVVVALMLGVVIQRYPEIVGNGREAIAALFEREWATGYVLALLALRVVVTPLTVGAGAVGGVFTPTLFLGAMLGYAFGAVAHHVLPGATAAPAAYALVGMGALLAGTTHAPLTSVLMVFEMTLDYNLVVPLLLAGAVASLFATGLARDSVYTEALRRKERPDGASAAIGRLRVRDLMRPDHVTIAGDLPLPEVLDQFLGARRNHLYVVDGDGSFLGVVNLHDVNRQLLSSADPNAFRAADLVRPRFETTTPQETLDLVLERFAREECERLPVLEGPGRSRVVGTISKRDILSVYSLELLQRDTTPRRAADLEAPVDRLVEEIAAPASAVGHTLGDARFRERHGVSVLMIRRARAGWIVPDDHTPIEDGDRLVVFGPRERLASLRGGAPGR
jgi:CIC family chloride channel protein